MARPRLEIDERQVELLAGVGCPNTDIATALGVSPDTIERRYAGAIKRGRANVCNSIRRKQVELALKGDRTMLIWTGKQMLGQKDKIETELSGTVVNEHRDADEEAIIVAADRIRERRRVGTLTG